jgi:hypothetical protein
MKDEASLARNTAGPAISSGRPQRPIGTLAMTDWPPSGAVRRISFRSVAVQPGHSALTRIPAGAHSTARVLVTEMTAALEAPYGMRPGVADMPATDATLITEPRPRSRRCAPTAWQT